MKSSPFSQLKTTTKIILLVLSFLVTSSLPARAQDMAAPAVAPAYTQEQIDQMVAPIALYPDQLVAQILMASTYPLEVVEAVRWRKQPENSQLSGDELASALAQQPWDPSVKSLVNFPQVLAMMDDHLQWVEQLGDAFLASQGSVMNSVQGLRQRAQNSGNLVSTPQQTVENEDQAIVIQPTNPQVIYVPYYNPTVVYGSWPYPDYQPYYFAPIPGYYNGVVGLLGFGIGIALVDRLWGWDRWDWGHHRIDIDNGRFAAINGGRPPSAPGGVWAHDPAHRHGVPYASQSVRARFQAPENQARQNFRGYASTPARSQASTPTRTETMGAFHAANGGTSPIAARSQQLKPILGSHPVLATRPILNTPSRSTSTRSTSAFESFSHGNDVQAASQRGAYSRATMSQQPARSQPSGGGSSFHSNSGGGGGHNARAR